MTFKAEPTVPGRKFAASSAALNDAIKAAPDIEAYLKQNAEDLLSQSLSEHLHMLLKQKGLRRSQVVAGSQLDKSYVYQIFSGEKSPSRDKLIAIAFGLRLSEYETKRMLKLAGYSELYERMERDAIILFAIQRAMSIFEVNELLYDHGYSTLGAPEN